jgi:hypothetical protein
MRTTIPSSMLASRGKRHEAFIVAPTAGAGEQSAVAAGLDASGIECKAAAAKLALAQ